MIYKYYSNSKNKMNRQLINQDGFVNATKLCQINGKQLYSWIHSFEAEYFILNLSIEQKQPLETLVFQKYNCDTFVHPKIAIYISGKISPLFKKQFKRFLKKFNKKK